MERIAAHEEALAAAALDELGSIDGVRVIGPRDTESRGATVAFVIDGVHPHDAGQVLDDRGVEVRVGHHCAWPLHRAFGVPATVRASFYLYNDLDEVRALGEAVREAQRFFGVG